jgi:hypothetical protein
VFIFTLSHTPGLLSWPAFLQAFALVASPRLGLQQNGQKEKKNVDQYVAYHYG